MDKKWRENLHNQIKFVTHRESIDQVVIEALDAAYVVGLDDCTQKLSNQREELVEIMNKISEDFSKKRTLEEMLLIEQFNLTCQDKFNAASIVEGEKS
jgi:hypothetical protein